jgi:hypothetical protein
MALGVAGSEHHRKVCKVVTSGRAPAALLRYKAQNFEGHPLLVCQRCCGDLVE